MKKIFTLCLLPVIWLTLSPITLQAQPFDKRMPPQDPLLSSYFQNRYLANPAMAGVDTGLSLNVGYRKQWKDLPDVPVTFALTADYRLGRSMGVGVTILNDQAGPLKQNRMALTYAYHLQLNEETGEYLHVGLTGALDNRHIEKRKNIASDPYVEEFNKKGNEFQADLGIAYSNKQLTLQAALPNLTRTFQNSDEVEPRSAPAFYAAASYKFSTRCPQINSIEPIVAFRGIKGYKVVGDVGAKVNCYKHTVNVFALYHTNNAVSAGVGFQFKHKIEVQASYTSQTAGIKTSTDGNFGLGIKIRLFK